MNAKLRKILNSLPTKPPRSRLEPHREFIEELRHRDRTFREIAEILAERCQVQVTGSGVHDFLRTRSLRERLPEKNAGYSGRLAVTHSAADRSPEAVLSDEVQRKITELKARKPAAKDSVGFEYDPEEPLRLKQPEK